MLDQADALLSDGLERCHLATAQAQLADRDHAARTLAGTAAHAGEVRVARNAARIYRTLLGDPATGARMLAACAAELMQRDAPADDWRLLAAGWREAGDRGAALHYLAHAAATASTVDELCAVSIGYGDAGDHDAARAAVERAAAGAGSVFAWAAVAKAYNELADLDGVTASLAAGEARIASADDAIVMAFAYAEHGADTADIDRCIGRAHELAATGDDDELLRTARYTLGRALTERAFTSPRDESDRRRSPDALLRRRPRSLGWPHAPSRLFDRLRSRIEPDQLRTIAGSDPLDAPNHFEGLEAIVSTGLIRRHHWDVFEALQLDRWADGRYGPIDHLRRAFTCTILCIDNAAPGSDDEGHETTIAVLLESCIALGTGAVDDLVALLAAMADAYGHHEMRPFAELALVLAAAWLDPSDPRIPGAVTRLVHDEARFLETATGVTTPSHGWLLRLTNFDQRHNVWRALARAILTPPTPELRQLAQLLGVATS